MIIIIFILTVYFSTPSAAALRCFRRNKLSLVGCIFFLQRAARCGYARRTCSDSVFRPALHPAGKKCHRTKSTPASPASPSSPSSSPPPHPVVQDALVTDTAVHLGAEADYISVGFLKVCDVSPWRGCDWNVICLFGW